MCSRISDAYDTCMIALANMHFSKIAVDDCITPFVNLIAACSTECPLFELYSKHNYKSHVEISHDHIVDYTLYRCHSSCTIQMDDTTIASCLTAYRALCDATKKFKQCVEKLAAYDRDDVLNMFATNLNDIAYFLDMATFKNTLYDIKDDLRHIDRDIVSIAILPNLTEKTEMMLRSLLFNNIKRHVNESDSRWGFQITRLCTDISCPVSDFKQSLFKLVLSNKYYPTMHIDYAEKLKFCMTDGEFKCVKCTTQFQRINFPHIIFDMHELAEVRKNVACTLEKKVKTMMQKIEHYLKIKDEFKYDFTCRELKMIEKYLNDLKSDDPVKGQCIY